MKRKLLELNAHGLRIGENHPRALISDHDVELIRKLAEGGMRYAEIAAKFEISKFTVGRICRYERREPCKQMSHSTRLRRDWLLC